MRAIKVGDYVLIRNDRQEHVERVARLTKTQVITTSPAYGSDGPTTEDRYRLDSGNQISSWSPWHRPFIVNDEPTQSQIETFEANMEAARKNWEIRSSADRFKQEITPALSSLLGLSPEQFRLDWCFDKETEVSWNLEAKKLTREALLGMCTENVRSKEGQ